MITLNDYLYSGDTVLKILQKYMGDLREDAKKNHNEIALVHCNFLLQIEELLEHNDFLTAQSQKIRDLIAYRIVISMPRCHLARPEDQETEEIRHLYEIANVLPEFLEERVSILTRHMSVE